MTHPLGLTAFILKDCTLPWNNTFHFLHDLEPALKTLTISTQLFLLFIYTSTNLVTYKLIFIGHLLGARTVLAHLVESSWKPCEVVLWAPVFIALEGFHDAHDHVTTRCQIQVYITPACHAYKGNCAAVCPWRHINKSRIIIFPNNFTLQIKQQHTLIKSFSDPPAPTS